MKPIVRTPSKNAPTILIYPNGEPANDLAKALASAFGVERIGPQSIGRLRDAGLNVQIQEPMSFPTSIRSVA